MRILAGFALFQDVLKCNRLFLDSNREDIENIALSELFRITRTTLHDPFHESSLEIRHKMGCRRYFAASRLEVLLSMRMTLDLLHELANTEVFCLFHNSMWQSRHSEVNVYFLALCEQTDGFFSLSTGLPVLT